MNDFDRRRDGKPRRFRKMMQEILSPAGFQETPAEEEFSNEGKEVNIYMTIFPKTKEAE